MGGALTVTAKVCVADKLPCICCLDCHIGRTYCYRRHYHIGFPETETVALLFADDVAAYSQCIPIRIRKCTAHIHSRPHYHPFCIVTFDNFFTDVGERLGGALTVTAKVCVADKLPVSVALTVTLAEPIATVRHYHITARNRKLWPCFLLMMLPNMSVYSHQRIRKCTAHIYGRPITTHLNCDIR